MLTNQVPGKQPGEYTKEKPTEDPKKRQTNEMSSLNAAAAVTVTTMVTQKSIPNARDPPIVKIPAEFPFKKRFNAAADAVWLAAALINFAHNTFNAAADMLNMSNEPTNVLSLRNAEATHVAAVLIILNR